MARVQYGTIITGIAGSIGGTTYSTNRSGTIAKARIVGKRSINHNQSTALSLSLSITNAWNALTNTNKNLFNDYALANTFTDRFGRVKMLTGFQWFKQLCQTSLYFNGSLITTPPLYAIPDALPAFEVIFDGGSLVVAWDTPIDPDTTKIYVFATPPIRGNARTQRSTYRMIDVRSLDVSSEFNVTSKWDDVFGLDFESLSTSGSFNINILIYPINATSLVSSAAQFSVGSTS